MALHLVYQSREFEQNGSILHPALRLVIVCRYNFTVRRQEVEKLATLELQQVSDFYAQHVPQSSKTAKRLAVHVVSSKHAEDLQEAKASDVASLDDFKSKLSLCDSPVRPVL